MPLILGFLRAYWQYALLAGVIIWGGYQIGDWIGDRREEQVVARYAKAEAKRVAANKKLLEQEEQKLKDFEKAVIEKDQKVGQVIADQALLVDRLSIAIKNLRSVQVLKEVPSENGKCPVVNLNAGWMRCYNAANTRSAEDLKACEAAGVYGPVSETGRPLQAP